MTSEFDRDENRPAASLAGSRTHRAGLFDIRVIIGLLLGLYGIVLVLVGIFGSTAEKTKADGMNINLYAGIGMVVVALVFFAWTKARPIVVPDDPADIERADAPPAH